MTDDVHDQLVTAIPRPRVIRERIAAMRRERDVLSRLLKVSEYAAERLATDVTDDAAHSDESEVSHG